MAWIRLDPVTRKRLHRFRQIKPDLAAVDIDAFCEAAARLSVLAASLDDAIDEIDINPVILHPAGCIAVDALVVGRSQP